VSAASRYFGIARTTVYQWRQRFEAEGVAGLRDRSSRPTMIHFQIPPEVIALVCQVRRERGYGAPRLSLILERYHQVYISPTTLLKICGRGRAGPRRANRSHGTSGNGCRWT